ncbi:MAG TPA: T9SS type A sorting domain-containing protein [bacterium]|nr:T9SS type A sorting domain-containing protein [bacterium]HPN43778.1 T9SS type A sorting domain-containing protein [bacterium]
MRVYQDTAATTGIKKKVNEPRLGLLRNYPNPFNPTTTIVFDVPQQQDIRLQVVNVAGQEVASDMLPDVAAGEQRYPFNAAHLPGGVYFCRLQFADGSALVNKMVVVK